MMMNANIAGVDLIAIVKKSSTKNFLFSDSKSYSRSLSKYFITLQFSRALFETLSWEILRKNVFICSRWFFLFTLTSSWGKHSRRCLTQTVPTVVRAWQSLSEMILTLLRSWIASKTGVEEEWEQVWNLVWLSMVLASEHKGPSLGSSGLCL